MDSFLKYEDIETQSTNKFRKGCAVEINKHSEIPGNTDVDKELDKLFAPRTVRGQIVRVSRKQATLFEIYELTEKFDNTLKDLEDEHTGFSNKLRDMYGQLFDELIRQEILVCPDRGSLLINVKSEAVESLKAMKKLYRSCFAYAITKNLIARKNCIQMRKQIPKLEEQINFENEKLQSMRSDWAKKKREEEEKERIKTIERSFIENQLIIANQQMVNRIEDAIDTEHRWLKDLDKEQL